MPRFYTGDELGNVKSIYCSESPDGAWIIESSIVHEAKEADKSKALQKLSVHSSQDGTLVRVTYFGGTYKVHLRRWIKLSSPPRGRMVLSRPFQ